MLTQLKVFSSRSAGLAGFAAAFATTPALAHHPMGGVTPQTLWQGFASGIGHPIIGPDHFIFIVLAGLVFSMARSPLPLAATMIVSGLIGTLVRVSPIAVPFAETVVAITLVAAGALVLYRAFSGGGADGSRLAGVVALAGVAHGFAWGESVVGADAPVIGSYLAGLALLQFAVLMAVVAVLRVMAERAPTSRVPALAAAGGIGVMAGVGFLLA